MNIFRVLNDLQSAVSTLSLYSLIKMSGVKHLSKGSQKPELPDDGVLRLYSMRFCPYAHRVHLVLDAKKIPYHSIYINLTEKPEWLTEVSALAKVPALQLPKEPHNPSLIESLIIAEYLDEKYPEYPLFPKDPLLKAQEKILIERFSSVITLVYKVLLGTAENAADTISDMYKGLAVFEEELQRRGTIFFGGEKPGMLDYMIWPWCERSKAFEHLPGVSALDINTVLPLLLKWRLQMMEDEAVKVFYLDGETHAKYIISRREGYPNYDLLL